MDVAGANSLPQQLQPGGEAAAAGGSREAVHGTARHGAADSRPPRP